jgi:hypothetical protein
MYTQRLAGMVGLLAVVILGLVGVDRWNKDAKARSVHSQVVSSNDPVPSLAQSTIHYQVDPSAPPVPQLPPVPKETPAPPLISTGELDKKLKESLDNLQKALPKLPTAEESAAPPPEPEKKSAPPPSLPRIADSKADPIKLPPPPDTTAPDPIKLPPPPDGTAKDSPKNSLPPVTNVPAPANLDVPSIPPAANQPPAPTANPTLPPPPSFKAETDSPKALNPGVIVTPGPVVPILPAGTDSNSDPNLVRRATTTIASQDEFRKRLMDLEVRYLKDTIAELDRRIQQMPKADADRRKLEVEHQRQSDRLARLMKAAEWAIERQIEKASGVKETIAESPWTMHMETVEGKTVLHAVVHRKARFKIVCDRLDLQTPRGTVLAVGQVQLSGEGFQGMCERLSIPLNDDRLILEGNAQMAIRTQPMAMTEGRADNLPPVIDHHRPDDKASSSSLPMLHLKGDHLDIRWNDLVGSAPGNVRLDDPNGPMLNATPGPMVKVAYTPARNEQWSAWGTLRRTTQEKDGRAIYVIEGKQSQPLAYVHTPAGLSLTDYVGKRVSVFGRLVHEDGRSAPCYTASHVAWE